MHCGGESKWSRHDNWFGLWWQRHWHCHRRSIPALIAIKSATKDTVLLTESQSCGITLYHARSNSHNWVWRVWGEGDGREMLPTPSQTLAAGHYGYFKKKWFNNRSRSTQRRPLLPSLQQLCTGGPGRWFVESTYVKWSKNYFKADAQAQSKVNPAMYNVYS